MDIQKCEGRKQISATQQEICVIRDKCYRYTAYDDGESQAWGNPAEDFTPEKGCSLFYEREK